MMGVTLRVFSAATLIAWAIGGCQSIQTKADPQIPSRAPNAEASAVIPNLDPGAMRLQDISGALLMYFATHRKLPNGLDELKPLADIDEPLNFISPVSNKPYIYTPDGIILQDQEKRMIVYDPVPTANNYREAIVINEPIVGQPLVAKVIAIPESFFLLHPPK